VVQVRPQAVDAVVAVAEARAAAAAAGGAALAAGAATTAAARPAASLTGTTAPAAGEPLLRWCVWGGGRRADSACRKLDIGHRRQW
jgi:hypothetical protein